MPKQAEWNSFKNILCVRPDNLGDVIMTIPAIRALRESVKGRKITLLASSAGSAITPYISCIDNVITFDPPWQGDHDGSAGDVNKLVSRLRKEQFDAAVIFTVYSQSPLPAAMICYMAGIPRVAGYCRENPYHLISDWIPDKEPLYDIKHEVKRQTDLVKRLGIKVKDDSLSLDIPQDTLRSMPLKLQGFGVDIKKPWLVLHPGVSEARRRYPAELFAEVAHALASEMNYQVIITGVKSESELAEYIADTAGNNVFSIAGGLRLEELIALIKLAPLVISNNTGPVHIAAAVGTPVVVLYALTNPQHSPWKVEHIVLPFDVPAEMRSHNTIVSFAYERAFADPPAMVSPQQVIAAAKQLLLRHRRPAGTEIVKV